MTSTSRPPAGRVPASSGIHGIARRGRQHHPGVRQRRAPIPAFLHRLEQLAMLPLVPREAVDRAGEVRKRLEVAAAFEV